MQIVEFENGNKIQEAYVEIDGKQYVITPAQYEGNTPLSAYNVNRLQKNLLTKIYMLAITENKSAGEEITLTCSYKVGQDVLDVYLNGERLGLSSDTTGTDGHYQEVGEKDSISNKIKTTTDWQLEKGDILTLIVRGDYSDTES